jgi:uncharacterized protein YprB with RNaseH-like and TPR domain
VKSVVFDLETTDLKALFGRILCCSFGPADDICDANPDPMLKGSDCVYTLRGDDKKFKSRSKLDDGKLAVAIRDELERYDLIIGWNCRLFDIPFLNSRLSKVDERPLRPHFVLDLMWYAGGSSQRIGSRKLVNVQKYYKLPVEKTEIDWDTWREAAMMEKDAMDIVVQHCEADIEVTRELYPRLLPFVGALHR